MKLKGVIYGAVVSLAVLAGGCDSPEKYEPTPNENDKPTIIPGRPLESGKAIVSSATKGVAPLAVDFCYSSVVVGSVYESSSYWPDLFVCGTGGLTSTYGGKRGLNYSKFCGVDSQGRLIYSKMQAIKTAPWDVESAAVKIVKIAGEIYGIQVSKTKINVARYDKEARSFGTEWTYSNKLTGVPYGVSTFDFVVGSGGTTADLTIMCYSVTGSSPESDYVEDSLYDSAGFYFGTIPEGVIYRTKIKLDDWTQDADIVQVGKDNSVIIEPTTVAQVSGKDWSGYLMANKAGALKYLSASSNDVADYLVDTEGKQLVNRSNVKRITVVNADRDGQADDFITSGEGSMWLYRYSGKRNSFGTPIYKAAELVLMEEGDLFSGSLTVPNVVDWDGDGRLDVVTGNSEGRLMFFKNHGTDAEPVFLEGEYMQMGGEEFCVRAGYYELQGPRESCWGYLCPTVFDWNGDGLYDIVFSYNEGKYMYMPNIGTATNPILGTPRTIFIDGMELYGVWRVRPAIARIGDRVMMMIMDGENALHIYWQTSDTTVEDGGKAVLWDGNYITGHNNREQTNVQFGRGKLNFVDWDGDGALDLLVGTIKRSSFPFPDWGLPMDRVSFTGMQVLYFHNEGTSAEPRYAYPGQFLVNGKDKALGAHSNAPVGCMLGESSEGPNLVVGVESGKFMFFHRSQLSTATLY